MEKLTDELAQNSPFHRQKALLHISFKLQYNLLTLNDLTNKATLYALLNCFNFNEVPEPELILDIISKIVSTSEGASLFSQCNGIEFLIDLANDDHFEPTVIFKAKQINHSVSSLLLDLPAFLPETKPTRPPPPPPVVADYPLVSQEKIKNDRITSYSDPLVLRFDTLVSSIFETLHGSSTDFSTEVQQFDEFLSNLLSFLNENSINLFDCSSSIVSELFSIIRAHYKAFLSVETTPFVSTKFLKFLLPIIFGIPFQYVQSNLTGLVHRDIINDLSRLCYNGKKVFQILIDSNLNLKEEIDFVYKTVQSLNISSKLLTSTDGTVETLLSLVEKSLLSTWFSGDASQVVEIIDKILTSNELISSDHFNSIESIIISLMNSPNLNISVKFSVFLAEFFTNMIDFNPNFRVFISENFVVNIPLDTEGHRIMSSFLIAINRFKSIIDFGSLSNVIPFLVSSLNIPLFYEVSSSFLSFLIDFSCDFDLFVHVLGLFLADSHKRQRFSQNLVSKFPKLVSYDKSFFTDTSLETIVSDPLSSVQSVDDEQLMTRLSTSLSKQSKSVLTLEEINQLIAVILEDSLSVTVRISALNSLSEVICSRDHSSIISQSLFEKLIDSTLVNPVPGFVFPVLVTLCKCLLSPYCFALVSAAVVNQSNLIAITSFVFHPRCSFRKSALIVISLSFLAAFPNPRLTPLQSIILSLPKYCSQNFVFPGFSTETLINSVVSKVYSLAMKFLKSDSDGYFIPHQSRHLIDLFFNQSFENFDEIFEHSERISSSIGLSTQFDWNCVFSPLFLLANVVKSINDVVFDPLINKQSFNDCYLLLSGCKLFFDYLFDFKFNSFLAVEGVVLLFDYSNILCKIFELNWFSPEHSQLLSNISGLIASFFERSIKFDCSLSLSIPKSLFSSILSSCFSLLSSSSLVSYQVLNSGIDLLSSILSFALHFAASLDHVFSLTFVDSFVENLVAILNSDESLTFPCLNILTLFFNCLELSGSSSFVDKKSDKGTSSVSKIHGNISNNVAFNLYSTIVSKLTCSDLELRKSASELFYSFLTGINQNRMSDLFSVKKWSIFDAKSTLSVIDNPRLIDCLSLVVSRRDFWSDDVCTKILDFLFVNSSTFFDVFSDFSTVFSLGTLLNLVLNHCLDVSNSKFSDQISQFIRVFSEPFKDFLKSSRFLTLIKDGNLFIINMYLKILAQIISIEPSFFTEEILAFCFETAEVSNSLFHQIIPILSIISEKFGSKISFPFPLLSWIISKISDNFASLPEDFYFNFSALIDSKANNLFSPVLTNNFSEILTNLLESRSSSSEKASLLGKFTSLLWKVCLIPDNLSLFKLDSCFYKCLTQLFKFFADMLPRIASNAVELTCSLCNLLSLFPDKEEISQVVGSSFEKLIEFCFVTYKKSCVSVSRGEEPVELLLLISGLNLVSFVGYNDDLWLGLTSDVRNLFLETLTKSLHLGPVKLKSACFNCLNYLCQNVVFSTSLVSISSFFTLLLSKVLHGNTLRFSDVNYWYMVSNCLQVTRARSLAHRSGFIGACARYVVSDMDVDRRRKSRQTIVPNQFERCVFVCLALFAYDQNLTHHLFKYPGFVPCVLELIIANINLTNVETVVPLFAILRCLVGSPDATAFFSSVNFAHVAQSYLTTGSLTDRLVVADFFSALLHNKKLLKEIDVEVLMDAIRVVVSQSEEEIVTVLPIE
ncbi:hypothetical protein RCL1_001253 [Eukaryota sp. TZLM3-RCL]